MANIFVVSDTHFGHAGILNFKLKDGTPMRPFSCVEEMDQFMVDRWNAVVRPQDKVYHLGDVAMHRKHIATVGRCNGHKRLVRGNHDTEPTKHYLPFFEDIYGSRLIDSLLLTHIPVHPESLRYNDWINVHGHVHSNVPQGHFGPRHYNVSVEVMDYTPISIEDLKKRLPQIEKIAVDIETAMFSAAPIFPPNRLIREGYDPMSAEVGYPPTFAEKFMTALTTRFPTKARFLRW